MLRSWIIPFAIYCITATHAWKYDEAWTKYNLNTNKDAQHPLEYSGEWEGHQYTPSPENWRFPFYTLFLDRWVNGDPSNDNINGTKFEHDLTSNQMRNGGDLQGLIDSLDYLRGMGIKGIYIAGSPFINAPAGYDSYSPLDLSLLDWHFGDIAKWRETVNEIHARGMYVLLDNTFATLGDLIGFEGYLNKSTPFSFEEHRTLWKSDRRYVDFDITNDYNDTCNYPRFWLETGFPVGEDVTSKMKGCYNSELDAYGATEAFGVYPDWRRQLTKFADVQDRLRDWHEPTRLKLENFYCMVVSQLDIDGFRYDKAMQSTVDAMGSMNAAMRNCARKYGKNNFFLPGEITGGNVAGTIFIGRGRQPDQLPENLTLAATLNNNSDDQYFIRDLGQEGLDAGAFHYTTYRTLTRFLGMDGNLEAGYDSPKNWVDQWNNFIMTNDLINANTGEFDPRHMYGVTNQDVFRWGAIRQGVERQLLGHYITTLLMPGIPLLLWGEEQAFYLLDNSATNYIFGRQPMSAATAWMQHGCYSFEKPSTQYFDWPIEAARKGCEDETQMHDHRDPTHPIRNIIRHMYRLRELYPVLNDGLFLQQLSNQTEYVTLPGSSGVATEFGLWSVLRSQFPGVQDLTTEGNAGDLSIWMLYSNKNDTTEYTFDCQNNATELNTTALIAPYDQGTTVKNLFYPFDEITLDASVKKLGINGSTEANGCVAKLSMPPFGFKAYVPKASWNGPIPMLTKFSPGHDARIEATAEVGSSQDVDIEFQFSEQMTCESITDAISFNSTTATGNVPGIKSGSVSCAEITPPDSSPYVGYLPSKFSYKATLQNVEHGVHALTIDNPTGVDGLSTNAKERVVFRLGAKTNPVVFPLLANYSRALITQDHDKLTIHHSALGATLWRYSTNWGSSFSDWQPLQSNSNTIEKQPWSGTKLQKWDGVHVRVEYFSPLVGQSDIVQQGDISFKYQRRFPSLHWNGPYNLYGYDAGLDNRMTLVDDNTWDHHFMAEWVPQGVSAQINVWGINPDKQPDQSFVFGDVDGDSILDRLPPSSLSSVSINITKTPPRPYLGWRVTLNDGTLKFVINPSGSMYSQLALYILLWIVPIIGALTAVWLYQKSFYDVKFNQVGVSEKTNFLKLVYMKARGKGYEGLSKDEETTAAFDDSKKKSSHLLMPIPWKKKSKDKFRQTTVDVLNNAKRRTVLIATMEYNISDWNIKIKIGGLGVMAQLMGDNLKHQDLIWVVPCVGGVEYPIDTPAEPMQVVIMGSTYDIKVQYHKVNNITYVLLDAPVFRQQSKAEPYPARMDDMTSAIYYSAYNQAIAHTINRFPIDLYHINDYHGTIAPLYLLPRTVPCCLSLHNAEFQGLWPMRTKEETAEVCSVFNLPVDIAARYVQFGEVFNLLHAGASILREHQNGFGAVGVSKKYGKRAFARYAIFWGLRKVQALPNPDPSDLAPLEKNVPKESEITVDPEYEAKRGELRIQAQDWAGLNQDADAELFVFVGRWSLQKGIDLIADVFPAVLEENPKAQLICVGPVIDLYGKFAAAKLDKMMQVYPGRVFSKPEFTALPPFIFSGAEFALIPSRDEPFGLVAVEFGRKGALGVGNRVGGLGQMPGWWATVESNTTSHLTSQFKIAIQDALASDTNTRALMRARSAKQRFPVAQWVEDLEILQTNSIKIHDKVEAAHRSQATGEQFGINTVARGHQPHDSWMSTGTFTPSLGRSGRGISVNQLNEKLNAVIAKDNAKRLSKRPPPPLKGLKGKGLIRSSSKRGPGHVQSEIDNSKPHTRLNTPRESEDNDEGRPRMPFFVGFDAGRADSVNGGSDDETDVESMFDEPDNLPQTTGQIGTRARDGGSQSPNLRDQIIRERSAGLNDLDLELPRAPFAGGSGMASPQTPSHPASGTASPLLPPEPTAMRPGPYSRNSTLSLDGVIGSKTDYNLQKVDPFFTDSTGEYFRDFQHRLDGLNASNSDKTCIEEFLVKSEKKWFDHYRDAKLGRLHKNLSQLSLNTAYHGAGSVSHMTSRRTSFSDVKEDSKDEFLLGDNYTPPTGLARTMQLRLLGWPVYSFFLAFGQIIAANSYQITLLTGEVGQTAEKLYVIASIYLVTSIGWWFLFRSIPSRWTLSLPFALYGLAFIFIGVAHFAPSYNARGWIQNLGTAWYACASSSGSIFFATNFGDEGGAPAKVWVFRACIIQGTQQIYVVALWAWGSYLSKRQLAGVLASEPVTTSWKITAICFPIAVFLWAVGLIVFYGLPSFYRQHPGTIRSFYTSIARRKIILWFFITVLIQNFFLSAPYGRNWAFLFSSTVTPMWVIMCLVVLFFIFVWAAFLGIFAYFSKSHSWLIPLFAIGLLAPRWAQIWWGTSNIGLYLPWVGDSPILSAVASRSLWLWLGTLDTIQGVGFGMILLVTLTRTHVAFTLIAAQVLGSIATMVARACAPNNIGPGPISPDISKGVSEIGNAWFWISLIMNCGICVGFAIFFRKEQLSKP